MATASLELLADSSQIRTATKDLDKLSASGAKAESAQKGIESTAKRTNAAFAGIGRSAGQAGIQIQQFVGQVQGGQSAMLALSQQGADLGFVLGAPLAGAIVGIGASLAGFLLPSIINSSTEISELVERINDLDEAVERTTAQNRVLAQSNEAEVSSLSKRNQQIAEQIELLQERIRLQSTAGTGTDTGQFAVPRSAEENQRRYAESIKETNAELELLRGELDTNNQDIIRLSNATAKLGDNTEVAAGKVQGISTSLQTQIVALKGGAQAAEVYALTQKAIADETESQLPRLIELVNQKYELKRAQEAAAESAKQEAAAQKEYASVLDQIIRNEERRQQTLQNAASGTIGLTSVQQLEQNYTQQRDLLLAAQDEGIASKIAYEERLTELERQYTEQRNQIQNQALDARLSAERSVQGQILGLTSSVFGEIASTIEESKGKESAAYKVAFLAAKGAAIAQAIIQTELAAVSALAPPPLGLGPVAGAPYAQVIRGLGYASVGIMAGQAITGFEKGGYTGNYGTKEVAGVVHGQEFVMNARATRANRGALEAMNSGKSLGGDTYVNVTNNATNSEVSTEERQDAQGNRVIDIVVNNISQRGKIHKAMTQTTTAGNRI